jgi:hypothetical protein
VGSGYSGLQLNIPTVLFPYIGNALTQTVLIHGLKRRLEKGKTKF